MDSKVIRNVDFKRNERVRRKIHPLLRFFLDGFLFLLIFFAVTASIEAVKRSMRRSDYARVAKGGAVGKLEMMRPGVSSFADAHNDNLLLIFLDFKCTRCARVWKDIQEYLPRISERYGIAIILSDITLKDPVYNMIYDMDRTIAENFNISVDPSMVVINKGVLSNTFDTYHGIVSWFRENELRGENGPVRR